MSEEKYIPGFQRGRAVALDANDTALLTITAAGVEPSASPLSELIRKTTAHLTPFAGEPLNAFAERLAAAGGLQVPAWRYEIPPDGPEEVEEEDDIIY